MHNIIRIFMLNSKAKFGRCIIVLLFVLLSLTLMTSQLSHEMIFYGLDFIWYKYFTNRPRLLCVVMQAGLGNLLFQYTFAYSMAKHSNFSLVCEQGQMKKLRMLFKVPNCTQHSLDYQVCFDLMPTVLQYDTGYDQGVKNITFKRDILFHGYFQSWKYWGSNEAIFREYFAIKENVKFKAFDIITSEIKKFGYTNRSEVTVVGIHIRRGDMISDNANFKYGYNVVSEEYVTKAKNYIRARVNGPIIYVVCSDSMDWARKAVTDPRAVFIEGNTKEVDFAVLSACDHFIMSVGTFGWWIGWHVKGIVIYYTKPFRKGSDLSGVFTDDYLTTFFYPGWIGLN